MKKDSKINDLLNEVMKQDPIEVYPEWENYTKKYNFPVYKLNLKGHIMVWKLPEIKEQHDKRESKNKEMVDSFFAQSIVESKKG